MKLIACALLAVLTLGSCNTMIGMGRDFQQLGKGMVNKAQGRPFNGGSAEDANLPVY